MQSRFIHIKKSARRRFTSLLPRTRRSWSQLSPVPQLLDCNDSPSEAEVAIIEDAIAKARAELVFLQQRSLGNASIQLEMTKKHRQECEDFIRIHKSLISPLRRLPIDILAEIFAQATYSTRPDYSTPPWSLSQVCGEWRTVALSLPYLWNCIDITFNSEKQKTHSFLQFLTMHLDRSQKVPLDIFVACAFDYVHHPVIDILTQYSERWGSTHLQVPGHTLQAFDAIQGHLPELHTLSLTLLTAGPYEVGTPLDIFEVAPRLRTVALTGTSASIRISLPWSQLTSYRDDTSNRIARDAVLSSALSLNNLYLASRKNEMLSELPVLPTVTLNELRRFAVTFKPTLRDHEVLPAGYIDGLTMPAVKEMRFINYYASHADALKSLITRSHASLTKLEFAPRSSLAPGILPSILQLTPQLTDLTILMPQVQDLTCLILNPLKPTDAFNEDIVPLLQSLVIHVPRANIHPGSESQIALIVASRCEGKIPMVMRLVFYKLNYWSTIQEQLEKEYSPAPTQALNDERLADLAGFNFSLGKDIPSIMNHLFEASKPNRFIRTNNQEIKLLSARLLSIFSDLDAFQFVNVNELYESSLHHLLYHVAQVIQESKVSHRAPFSFWKQRAEEILDKWNTCFVVNDLPNRRWAFQGFHSLVYIPTNHEIREYPDAALKMVYGMNFHADKYYFGGSLSALVPSDLEYCD